jgi:uncharacterized protein (DUF2235 family)
VRGGAFGLGLDQHIIDAYRQLVDNYDEGDDVYITGFSRGAYTARSLVGLIRNSGLLLKNDAALVDRAYALYRGRNSVDSDYARDFRKANSRDVSIKFLGLWDTVGALGIPLSMFKDLDAKQYAFHDTKLSSIVQNAFHALALDEHRKPYAATLWDMEDYKGRLLSQKVEQTWFTGAHADVGGGYQKDHPISTVTLRWMQKHAENCGLSLNVQPLPMAKDCISTPLHDSFREFLGGLFKVFSSRYYRPVGTAGECESVDTSVLDRLRACVDYRPKNDGISNLSSSKFAWE